MTEFIAIEPKFIFKHHTDEGYHKRRREWYFNPESGRLISHAGSLAEHEFNLLDYVFKHKRIVLISTKNRIFGFPSKEQRYGWQPLELECFRLRIEFLGVTLYKVDTYHKINSYVFLELFSDTDYAIFSFYCNDLIINEEEFLHPKT